MSKDVTHLHEKVNEVLMLAKLEKELPKGKSKMKLPQSNRLHTLVGMRNPGEGPKKSKEEVIFVKEVKCAEAGRKVAAVEKGKELKEGSVPGVEGKVTSGENGKNIKSSVSLAPGGKDTGGMYVLGKSRKEMWDRMKKMKQKVASVPPLVPAHVVHMKDYRPKGKTYRKAHYDPKEVADDKVKQILERRQRNDSKAGGLSRSRMWGKKHQELGGNRGFKRSYRKRPDRPFNFDEDEEEEGPSM